MSYGNRVRGNPHSVQKLLDENAQLIQAIVDYQNKGKAAECVQYQQLLHKNLMYLASLADSTQNIQSMIPPPPPTSQVTSTTPVPAAMGGAMRGPASIVPGNVQDRKGLVGASVDQGSAGIPNMPSQVISSAGGQMTGGMHTVPSAMTTGSTAKVTSGTPYGGNVSISSQSLDTSTPPSTGYPGNVNQTIAPNMAPTSQPMMPQQNYMPNMHTTRMQQQQQGQQFMMQQNIGYSRAPIQMHPSQQHQPQQINQQQPYMGNQVVAGQGTPGMNPYQQAGAPYDPYNQMQQHMNTGFSNPYGPQ